MTHQVTQLPLAYRVRTEESSGGVFSNTLTATIPTTESQDLDLDGMTEEFELNHGLDPQNSDDGIDDSDGDRFSNLEEFRAGTAPNPSSNAPVIDEVTVIGDDVVIRFSTVVGRTYLLECREGFSATWRPIVTLAGTGNIESVTDFNAARLMSCVYRIHIIR